MFTAIDQVANQHHLQLIKAALPYFSTNTQASLSVCIKLMELRNILTYYQRHDSCVQACGSEDAAPSMTEILEDIRNYCEGDDQTLIDQMLQMFQMLELYSMLAQTSSDLTFSGFPGFGNGTAPENTDLTRATDDACPPNSNEPINGKELSYGK